jgi:hypothetical protein
MNNQAQTPVIPQKDPAFFLASARFWLENVCFLLLLLLLLNGEFTLHVIRKIH